MGTSPFRYSALITSYPSSTLRRRELVGASALVRVRSSHRLTTQSMSGHHGSHVKVQGVLPHGVLPTYDLRDFAETAAENGGEAMLLRLG